MRVDHTSLNLFVTVAEDLNIARAAARRHIAASAVSKRMLDLETTYGTTLLLLTSKGVELTAAGEALLRHARSLFQVVDRIGAEMGAFASGLRGHVRLSANPSAITQFLPEILAEFMVRYPDIEIALQEATTRRSLQLLDDGLADIGIVGWGADDPTKTYAMFRSDNLALAVPEGHPLALAAGPVRFADTLDYDQVGLEEGSSIQAMLFEVAHVAGARCGRSSGSRASIAFVVWWWPVSGSPSCPFRRSRHMWRWAFAQCPCRTNGPGERSES